MKILLEVHAHEHADFMTEFADLLSSPAHWAFELLFSVLFDLIVISLIYGIVIKKVIIPRLKKTLHDEIDKEHGITPHD
jgi:hypothetical protein